MRIKIAIINYTSIVANLRRFEAAGLVFINGRISDNLPFSSLELILKLESIHNPFGTKQKMSVVTPL